MTDIQVRRSGPLFDDRARRAVSDFLDDAKQQIADAGVTQVQAELGRVLAHPTGYYASRITTNRVRDDRHVLDGGVIYGPWLAGVSSRNQLSTFAGYEHWRRATQRLQARVDAITEPGVRRMLDRIG